MDWLATACSETDRGGDARFSLPCGIVCDPAGRLYISDAENVITVGLPPGTWASPSISLQPQPQTNLAGAAAYFNVPAVGSAPFFYQWFKNGVPVPDATNSAYGLQLLSLSDAGDYLCVVTNTYGSATSLAAALTVQMTIILPNSSYADASRFGTRLDWSETNRLYRLQFKTNLADPVWQYIDPWQPGNGSNLTLTDPSASNSLKFYRLQSADGP